MIKTFTIKTENNGTYSSTTAFSPPGPFGFQVDLFATFTSPDGLHASGAVKLDGEGNLEQSKPFVATTGQRLSLGTWSVAHGNNNLVITGATIPPLVDSEITVEVEADLVFF